MAGLASNCSSNLTRRHLQRKLPWAVKSFTDKDASSEPLTDDDLAWVIPDSPRGSEPTVGCENSLWDPAAGKSGGKFRVGFLINHELAQPQCFTSTHLYSRPRPMRGESSMKCKTPRPTPPCMAPRNCSQRSTFHLLSIIAAFYFMAGRKRALT